MDTNKKFITPVGDALWCKVTEADEFQGKTFYKACIKMPTDDPKAIELMERLSAASKEAFDEMTAELKPPKKKACKEWVPFVSEYDEEGNETGNTIFAFKCLEKTKTKKGKILDNKPKLFDSKGALVPKGAITDIGNGSRIQISYTDWPFYNASSDSAGSTPILKAVRILSLVNFDGDADSYGFTGDDDEDGDGYSVDTFDSNTADQSEGGGDF
jgi:hypothetical protein